MRQFTIGPMEREDTGILIAVEGIDGAGKTTQARRLAEALTIAGETVVSSKEPTEGSFGQQIRESSVIGRMPLEDELHAFVEDRKEHVRDLILPALGDGKTVILDRYFYSTIAYQGARGADVGKLTEQMESIAPTPDAVILLDLPAEVGISRISQGRGETPNAFETLGALANVREIFVELAGRKEVTLIDAAQPIEKVSDEILRALFDGAIKERRCAKEGGCDDPVHCTYRIDGVCRWWNMRERLSLSAF